MIERITLQDGWSFRRLLEGGAPTAWESVSLPHLPFVPDLNGQEHWFGLCEYKRTLRVTDKRRDVRREFYVGAAMHTAEVFLDGVSKAVHVGGYLPFAVDVTSELNDGQAHEVLVRLDNRDDPDVPPGKPYRELDFCWYGGLYQEVELRTYPEVHITDSVAAGEVAGGGVFVRTRAASAEFAELVIGVHVANRSPNQGAFKVLVELWRDEVWIGSATSAATNLEAQTAAHVTVNLRVEKPVLWTIDTPCLHDVQVKVVDEVGGLVDEETVRYGIRTISFSRSGGFQINGKRWRLRGTNRHQEMPRVGYAAGRAAQYRDALRIKEAGFDYVRLAHYPQSPHFLDACDELGIVVMNAIPGWQFLGGPVFRGRCVQHARDLIRRDRNHPCVVLWELSLNETDMDDAFMHSLYEAGHQEYPGDQLYVCGWKDSFDVFIHSRQHGKIHTWSNADRALVVAEYGDWEFYAANHGFDQTTGAGVHALWSNSRQFRGDGERGLRQQATNHMLAVNDTLGSPAVLDGLWAMFDYARGYHPLRASCGVMDLFRLPKFSYYLYRSQRDGDETGRGWRGGYNLFIASHWVPGSLLRIPVYTNVDEVELRLNGVVVARKGPERTWMTQNLPHPPMVFDLERFESGVLEAIGFVDGIEKARHRVATPDLPEHLEIVVDTLGVSPDVGEEDVLFVHARICDCKGQLCVQEGGDFAFEVKGQAHIVGPATVSAEAGVASIVVRVSAGARELQVTAKPVGDDALCDLKQNDARWCRAAD